MPLLMFLLGNMVAAALATYGKTAPKTQFATIRSAIYNIKKYHRGEGESTGKDAGERIYPAPVKGKGDAYGGSASRDKGEPRLRISHKPRG